MPAPFPEARRFAAEYRAQLGQLGFADDGICLQGAVTWTDAEGHQQSELVEITFDGGFPFTPPLVRPVADTSPRSLHQERSGHLCLFERTELAGSDAPWRQPADLLDKVRRWFEQSAAGWPDDQDVDLERYLPTTEGLVLYDSDELDDKTGFLTLRFGRPPVPGVTRVGWQAAPVNARGTRTRSTKRGGRRRLRSKRAYGWLVAVGEVTMPILTWLDLAALLGGQGRAREMNIRFHGLQLVLVRYTRSGYTGYLALRVRPRTAAPGGIEITAQEAADDALSVRSLRAGDQDGALKNRPVAVVGCGAVGSQLADLLLRAGLRRVRLLDPQLLRPGNCVRHLAGPEYVGYPKAQATAAVLQRNGADTTRVEPLREQISTLEDARKLFTQVQLVIDATADNRATAMLTAAAQESGKTLLVVALMRQGGIAVVDRLGDPDHGTALPNPPVLPGAPDDLRERGCGDAVSRTPPHSAVAAATLATRLVIDELSGRAVPTTTFEVLEPQPDEPFTVRKVITS